MVCHGLHSRAEVVSRKYFPARSTSETSSVRRGMCCRTILLLTLGWCRSALAIAHLSLRGTGSLKMTMRLRVVTSTKFTLKNLQTQQVHQTQTWICTKYWKKITICCRMISTYIKKLDNHTWYLSQSLVSLSFLVTLFPWLKSEQWLRRSSITPR